MYLSELFGTGSVQDSHGSHYRISQGIGVIAAFQQAEYPGVQAVSPVCYTLAHHGKADSAQVLSGYEVVFVGIIAGRYYDQVRFVVQTNRSDNFVQTFEISHITGTFRKRDIEIEAFAVSVADSSL